MTQYVSLGARTSVFVLLQKAYFGDWMKQTFL